MWTTVSTVEELQCFPAAMFSNVRMILPLKLNLLISIQLQTCPEGGGLRLPGAGDHQEPCQEIFSVHQLPHLRLGQQGDYFVIPSTSWRKLDPSTVALWNWQIWKLNGCITSFNMQDWDSWRAHWGRCWGSRGTRKRNFWRWGRCRGRGGGQRQTKDKEGRSVMKWFRDYIWCLFMVG